MSNNDFILKRFFERNYPIFVEGPECHNSFEYDSERYLLSGVCSLCQKRQQFILEIKSEGIQKLLNEGEEFMRRTIGEIVENFFYSHECED